MATSTDDDEKHRRLATEEGEGRGLAPATRFGAGQ